MTSETRNRGDMIATYRIFKSIYKADKDDVFSVIKDRSS